MARTAHAVQPEPTTNRRHEHTAEDVLRVLGGRVNITSYDVLLTVFDKRPEYYYHWRHQRRVEFHKALGSEVVTKSNDDAHGGTYGVDSAWHAGDLILMRTPRDLYVERQKRKQDRFRALKSDNLRRFHSDGEALGVETYEDEDTGEE